MTDPPAAAALPPPIVPGLTGLTVLARGGYATVYRAVQESVARDVAVKVENRTLESERDRRRFLREARAAGRMSSHPHVVDLFDAGVTPGGHPYLIMELCDGSYADRMKNSPLGAAEARDVGVKIADALADAHALGVCHRDVKPANLLITGFGEPALADFGLAILAETRDASVTLDVLTPAYAPPELFRHSPPSTAVDVYALCATLFAVMRGRPPRWREDRNPSLVTLMELFNEPVPDLPGVPHELMDVLRAGMANDPTARPTAERLRDMLSAVRLSPADPPPPAPPSGTRARAAIPPPDDTPTVRRSGRSWRLIAAIAGGLVALALIVAGGIWYAGRGDPTADPTRTPGPTNQATTSSSPAAPTVRAGGPCLPALFAQGAWCPTEPECYGQLVVTGGAVRATRSACGQAHTWETFLLNRLASSTGAVDHATVAKDPQVRASCSQVNLATILGNPIGWEVEVLPPTPERFTNGDREFRCLAGKGPDKLTAQTIPVG